MASPSNDFLLQAYRAWETHPAGQKMVATFVKNIRQRLCNLGGLLFTPSVAFFECLCGVARIRLSLWLQKKVQEAQADVVEKDPTRFSVRISVPSAPNSASLCLHLIISFKNEYLTFIF
jgi:hypothetical protein